MKKILHIVEAFGGGVFSYMVDLANNLTNEFDITIAYSLRPQTPKDFKSYFNDKIKLIEIKSFSRDINFKSDIKAYGEIVDLEKKINPDVIHLHSSKAGVIGRLAFNSKKKNVFYTPHGYSFLKEDDSKVKRFFYRIIEAIAAKNTTSIIACGKGEYLESLKLSKSSVYISNGVDVECLESFQNKVELNKGKKTACIIGRICVQKNPAMYNKIANLLPEVDFLWIGDGELKDLLLSPNIKVTGWSTRKTTMTSLQKADFFILPSLWEGLPIALLEAMYFKKICLVSDVIGNNDVIVNEENGFICNDENEYAYNIKKIIKGDIDIERITNNAHNDVCRQYNTHLSSKKYAELYNSI